MSCRTGPSGQGGDHCRGHGDPGRRTVLRDCARRNVDVDVAVEHFVRDLERRRVRAGVGPGRPGGLLHDVAKLAGKDQLAFAAHGRSLDEHDVAAGRRVVHPGGDAGFVLPGHLLRVHFRASQQIVHHLTIDGDALNLVGCDLPGHLPGQPPDLPLQLADA